MDSQTGGVVPSTRYRPGVEESGTDQGIDDSHCRLGSVSVSEDGGGTVVEKREETGPSRYVPPRDATSFQDLGCRSAGTRGRSEKDGDDALRPLHWRDPEVKG